MRNEECESHPHPALSIGSTCPPVEMVFKQPDLGFPYRRKDWKAAYLKRFFARKQSRTLGIAPTHANWCNLFASKRLQCIGVS